MKQSYAWSISPPQLPFSADQVQDVCKTLSSTFSCPGFLKLVIGWQRYRRRVLKTYTLIKGWCWIMFVGPYQAYCSPIFYWLFVPTSSRLCFSSVYLPFFALRYSLKYSWLEQRPPYRGTFSIIATSHLIFHPLVRYSDVVAYPNGTYPLRKEEQSHAHPFSHR